MIEKRHINSTFSGFSGSLKSKTNWFPETISTFSWPLSLPRFLRTATTTKYASIKIHQNHNKKNTNWEGALNIHTIETLWVAWEKPSQSVTKKLKNKMNGRSKKTERDTTKECEEISYLFSHGGRVELQRRV